MNIPVLLTTKNSCFENYTTFASILVGRKCNLPNMSRVLVMDDEEETRTLIEKILESAGHEVVLAADGVEDMRQYLSTPFDLA